MREWLACILPKEPQGKQQRGKGREGACEGQDQHVPAQGAELFALLDDSVEEAQPEEQLEEGVLCS